MAKVWLSFPVFKSLATPAGRTSCLMTSIRVVVLLVLHACRDMLHLLIFLFYFILYIFLIPTSSPTIWLFGRRIYRLLQCWSIAAAAAFDSARPFPGSCFFHFFFNHPQSLYNPPSHFTCILLLLCLLFSSIWACNILVFSSQLSRLPVFLRLPYDVPPAQPPPSLNLPKCTGLYPHPTRVRTREPEWNVCSRVGKRPGFAQTRLTQALSVWLSVSPFLLLGLSLYPTACLWGCPSFFFWMASGAMT
jgi:hypothetical protein